MLNLMAALHLNPFTLRPRRSPEPRVHHPDWMSQEVHGHLAHIIWTQEDETLDCGIDRQQHPTDEVFMDNIVA